MPYAAQWFAEVVAENGFVKRDCGELMYSIPRVLVFSHISERDGAAFLRTIAKTLQENDVSVDYLIITTYEERLDGTQDLGGLSCFIRAQNTFTDCTRTLYEPQQQILR